MCIVMYSASAEHSTVYVKLVTGTAIAWSLSHMANNNNPFNLRYVLEKEKLSGTNFLDWEMNLKIVLKCEKKLYVLTSKPPKTPEANARAAEITSYKKYEDDARDVRCLMLATMTSELQRLHKDMEAHPMMTRLKGLYQGQARHERFK
ncbi:unnamed protein product, partial [Cuscuta campestris]